MSKEKQIEEMAKTICPNIYGNYGCDSCDLYDNKCCLPFNIARSLTDNGYRKQSENGIELPCKVGTTLYFIYNSPYADKPDLTPRIYKTADWYFEVDKTGIVINTSYIHSFNKEYDYRLGKTVFFTQEEAEKALAKMKGGAE